MNDMRTTRSDGARGGHCSAHLMPFGAQIDPRGVRFRIWAPLQNEVSLEVERGRTVRLDRLAGGWHEAVMEDAKVGDRYRFVLADGLRIPDPASRFQPDDCHGPSEVIDPGTYRWQDGRWKGRPWHEAVIYELHVGAFTPEGTFLAAARKLGELAEFGVTAVQLMPVADFPGRRNWGYDGVLSYAPDSSYGRPEDLKALVDAAHWHGLMVFLDVVYNHFGPDGNYLGAIAPCFVTERHHTPWGAALNFDGPDSRTVREFFIHNALYWIEEFHLDGLRLDAVHAILDDSGEHFLVELARRVRAVVGHRPVHIIAENEENQAALLQRGSDGRPLVLTAQWNDDVHHVLHTAATGEESGYYADYVHDTDMLGRALAEGVVFQGQRMPYRDSPRGEPSRHLPPTAFVSFLQNHDQVGNRALGERIAGLAVPEAARAVAAIYLLAPQIPMLFMGEEWGSHAPFPYFCDFAGDLAAAIRDGRRKEFARFPEFQSLEARERIPDPTAASTFAAAKLDWAERDDPRHSQSLEWYTRLLATRHEFIVPRLGGIEGHAGSFERLGWKAVRVEWRLGDGALLTLCANLWDRPLDSGFRFGARMIWSEGDVRSDGFGPWSVAWFLDQAPPPSDGLRR